MPAMTGMQVSEPWTNRGPASAPLRRSSFGILTGPMLAAVGSLLLCGSPVLGHRGLARAARRPVSLRPATATGRGTLVTVPIVPTLGTLAALGAALAGCDGPAAEAESHLDALPRLVAHPDRRVGDFDDPDIGFSQIAGVDVDRDGNLFVGEGTVPEIRVYGPEGQLLRRIGRRGSGPGEFESPPRFGIFGDTLWAVDSRTNRITLFDREGTLRSTGRTDGVIVLLPASYGYLLPWSMRPDGAFLGHFARIGSVPPGDAPTGVQPTDSIPVPFVLFDASGAVLDTIGWAARPPPRMWRPPWEEDLQLEFVEVRGRRAMVPGPPTTLPWWLFVTDGYVQVESPLARTRDEGEIIVTRFGLSGEPVYERVLHYRPVPYSTADLDSIATRTARGQPSGGVQIMVPAGGTPQVPDDWPEVARALRGAMRFPEVQLPIVQAWLAQDESVWLRRTTADEPEVGWILLDPDGTPRGELELPSNLRVVWHRGEVFWAVEPDDYGVPWLVRFTIQPGG